MNRIFWGTLVCAALCACSKDNPADDGQPVFLGDKAYLNVNIADASSLTRASAGDPEFESGDEHVVTDADFYFYDGNGVFVTQGKAWNGRNPNENLNENIEYFGNSIIVLKGLTQKGFPKYLVTVLNTPTGFEPGNTLDEMQEKLSGGIKTVDNFIMSTSSYVHENGKHFVTEVDEKYFKPEPVPNPLPDEVVEIFVERLAVKVTVKVDETKLKPVEGHPNTYALKATIAGNPNQGGDIAATDLYVKFLGWGLNATAKDSRMMKKIDASWADEKLGFAWKDNDHSRSYWGESYNYGKTDGAYGTADAKYVDYISAADANIAMGTSAYCAENTNSSIIVSDNPSAITSILLKAQLTDNSDGTGDLNLIRYNGLLYKEDQYLDHVLDVLQKKDLLNVYYVPEGDAAPLTQIDKEFVELASNGDGTVYVKLKTTTPTLYKKIKKEDGALDKEVINEDDKTAVNTTLKGFNTNMTATAYRGGLMYYNIRIEHLNNNDPTTEEGKTIIPEAKYGVVRNHHYVVNINSLSQPGTGVFDPDEVIIPGEDPNKDTYYVGAKINILSWKIVSQNVEL